MVEYLYSTKNYKKLILTDTTTSLSFLPKYISGIVNSSFDRYNLKETVKSTEKDPIRNHIFNEKKFDPVWAVKNGHLCILKFSWRVEKNNMITLKYIANLAAIEGHLDIVEWLWNIGTRATKYGVNIAVANGHLDVVEWLWDKGVVVTKKGANRVALKSNLDVVKWLWKKGVTTTKRGANDAIGNGLIDITKWLLNKNISFSKHAPNLASSSGNLISLKWLNDMNKKGIIVTPLYSSITTTKGYLEIIKWLQNMGKYNGMYHVSVKYGLLQITKYLWSDHFKISDNINVAKWFIGEIIYLKNLRILNIRTIYSHFELELWLESGDPVYLDI
jgi:hypothetical protein